MKLHDNVRIHRHKTQRPILLTAKLTSEKTLTVFFSIQPSSRNISSHFQKNVTSIEFDLLFPATIICLYIFFLLSRHHYSTKTFLTYSELI